MLSKHKRIKDKKMIKECRLDHCEHCPNMPAYGEPHHIYTVGSGGGDIKENLIQLSCANACHTKAHTGEISKDELLLIVAEREGKTVEQIKAINRRAMGYDVE
jgi:ferredoxin